MKRKTLSCIFFIIASSFLQAQNADWRYLQGRINNAIVNGITSLSIPKRVYHINAGLEITNSVNLNIDFGGATIISSEFSDANATDRPIIYAAFNTNLTLQNVSLDYNPLPFSQGTVIANDPNGEWHDVQIHAGYRSELSFFKWPLQNTSLLLHVFDSSTGILKYGSTFLSPDRVTSPSAGIIRFWFNANPDPVGFHGMQIGDFIVTQMDRGLTMSTEVNYNTTLKNINFYAGPWNILGDTQNEGGDYQFNMIPGPKPAGASIQRLVASSGGGYVGSNYRKGVYVHDCNFYGFMDDIISIGVFRHPIKNINTATNTIQTVNETPFLTGDTLIFYDKLTDAITGVKKIVSSPGDGFTYTLNNTAGISSNDFCYNHSASGAGFIIENCTLNNTDGAGINMRTNNTEIRNCFLNNIGQAALDIALLKDSYDDGPFINNFTMKNNTIKNVGRSDIINNPEYNIAAAINIGYVTADVPAALNGTRNIRNILIDGNFIDSSRVWGISLNHMKRATVKNNKISNTNLFDPKTSGSFLGVTPSSPIFLYDVSNIKFINNCISNTGPFASSNGAVIHPTSSLSSIDTSGISYGYCDNNLSASAAVSTHTSVIFGWPNPAESKLYISAPVYAYFELIDLSGKRILRGKYSGSIDVSNLHKGLYFIAITEKSNESKKILKFIKE
jgi:hypothetical protein